MAVVAYRCRTLEEVGIKSAYLLTTGSVKDFWDEDAHTFLKSLLGDGTRGL
jgi:hypothetical protein